MIDYANIGTIIGARAAIAQVVADGERVLSDKDASLAAYREALAVEQASRLALDAQIDLLLAELRAVAPSSRLLRRTGRVFADGRPESVIARVYVETFDRVARSKGVRNPSSHREALQVSK